jgi:hypothetical protein
MNPSIEQLNELLSLDADTGVLRRKTRPANCVKVGDAVGSPDSHGYLKVVIKHRNVLVHRIVFAMSYGFWPDAVDHINGKPLDNRPANLRAANRTENNRNARKRSDNKSGIKNIHWSKQKSKWIGRIYVDGKSRHFGYFNTLDQAAVAAKAAREKYHGEFARHE